MQAVELDHVGLAVAERGEAERFFGETLRLRRDRTGLFRIGRGALELLAVSTEGGASRPTREGIDHLALRIANLERATRDAADAGVPAGGGGECLFGASQVAWLDPNATLGVRICLVERWADGSDRVPGADGLIERIDHVGIASEDNLRAHAVFTQLGLPLESSQTDTEVRVPAEFFVSDKYGVVFNTRPAVAVGGLKVAFFNVGDCDLEVLQDFDPNTASQRPAREVGTKRDQSAISRFIQTRGPGAHHIALKVSNLDAMLRRLESAGVDLIDRGGRPGSRRAEIAFLHPKSTHGVLFHLVQREELAEE
jgi:methylmalonyl-CoA epimerase